MPITMPRFSISIVFLQWKVGSAKRQTVTRSTLFWSIGLGDSELGQWIKYHLDISVCPGIGYTKPHSLHPKASVLLIITKLASSDSKISLFYPYLAIIGVNSDLGIILTSVSTLSTNIIYNIVFGPIGSWSIMDLVRVTPV